MFFVKSDNMEYFDFLISSSVVLYISEFNVNVHKNLSAQGWLIRVNSEKEKTNSL